MLCYWGVEVVGRYMRWRWSIVWEHDGECEGSIVEGREERERIRALSMRRM